MGAMTVSNVGHPRETSPSQTSLTEWEMENNKRRGRTRRMKSSNDTTLNSWQASSTLRSTLAGVEAVTVGAVNVVIGTVKSALRGIEDVGGELGTTAVNTVRGSLRAAEVIGGDVARLASDAATGALDAADRIGSAAARTVRDIVAEAAANTRLVGRKPLRAARGRPTGNGRRRDQSAA